MSVRFDLSINDQGTRLSWALQQDSPSGTRPHELLRPRANFFFVTRTNRQPQILNLKQVRPMLKLVAVLAQEAALA